MYGGSKVNFDADIFVTTPHSKPPPHFARDLQARVHRLIIDESHLYEKGADPKLPSTRVFKQRPTDTYMADVVWCVTGTPFSNSLSQLEMQARMMYADLGPPTPDLPISEAGSATHVFGRHVGTAVTGTMASTSRISPRTSGVLRGRSYTWRTESARPRLPSPTSPSPTSSS